MSNILKHKNCAIFKSYTLIIYIRCLRPYFIEFLTLFWIRKYFEIVTNTNINLHKSFFQVCFFSSLNNPEKNHLVIHVCLLSAIPFPDFIFNTQKNTFLLRYVHKCWFLLRNFFFFLIFFLLFSFFFFFFFFFFLVNPNPKKCPSCC